ncbi:MAG: PilN domain-containing protein [Planctomycetota bacterium]
MITINLLPQEFRRTERTSIKVFLTIILSLISVCASLGYFGHVYLYEFKTIETERKNREEKLSGLMPQAQYDDALVAEKEEFQKRSKTIQTIANSRVLWTEMMDLFIDIVNNNGNVERHNVWFKNISVKPGTSKTGPVMTLQALSQSASFTKQANFIDDVSNHEQFFRDMYSITDPGGRVVKDATMVPPESISFKLELKMKPPSRWARNQAKKKKR